MRWIGRNGIFSRGGREEYSGKRLVGIKNNKNVKILTPKIEAKSVLLMGLLQVMDGGEAMDFCASTLKAKGLLAFCQFLDDRTW